MTERVSAAWDQDIPWFAASAEHVHVTSVCIPFHKSSQVAYGLRKTEDLQRDIFYGSCLARAGGFAGLAEFYGTVDLARAQCAVNVLDAGGIGHDNCSVYLVGWGARRLFMVHPPSEEKKAVDSPQRAALVVEDWRYAARVANIDLAERVDLPQLMAVIALRLPVTKGAVFYLNRECGEMLERQTGSNESFRDLPVRIISKLRDDEARVV